MTKLTKVYMVDGTRLITERRAEQANQLIVENRSFIQICLGINCL